jgi:flavin reductase (DIM6/NTAB) family NADH-FMN oxidoreductase RutF
VWGRGECQRRRVNRVARAGEERAEGGSAGKEVLEGCAKVAECPVDVIEESGARTVCAEVQGVSGRQDSGQMIGTKGAAAAR